MSTYTRRRHGPQEQQKVGETHSQRGVVPFRREDAEEHPFPVKPVSYRGSLQKQTQFHTTDFEKLSISSQSEDTGYLHSNEDTHRIPSEEMELDRAIHVRKLMLQESLCRVIEKIRENCQMDGAETEKHSRRPWEEVESGKEELQRSRGVRREEIQHEDVEQPRTRKDQKTHRYRTKNDKQETRQGVSETHGILSNQQEVYEEQRKSRWQNVKEQSGRKGADKMDSSMWGKTYKKSHSENMKTYKGTSQANEVKYRERVEKKMNSVDLDQHTEQKAAHRSGGKQSGKCSPPVALNASHFSGPQQEQFTDISLETLPCKICNRKFVRERLEKHVSICKKVKQAHRPIYNSYAHRTKGSSAEEFFKTHTRSKTPEIIKKKFQGRMETRNISDQHQSQPPAAVTQSKPSKKTQLKPRN